MFIDARHIQMCMNSLFRFDATHAWKAHLLWAFLGCRALKNVYFFMGMGIKGCGQNGMHSGMVLTISEWLCKVDIN